jgi:hypothetical protein
MTALKMPCRFFSQLLPGTGALAYTQIILIGSPPVPPVPVRRHRPGGPGVAPVRGAAGCANRPPGYLAQMAVQKLVPELHDAYWTACLFDCITL